MGWQKMTKRLEPTATWRGADGCRQDNPSWSSQQCCRIHLFIPALPGFTPASAGSRPQLLIGYLGVLSGCVGWIVVRQLQLLSHGCRDPSHPPSLLSPCPPPVTLRCRFLPLSWWEKKKKRGKVDTSKITSFLHGLSHTWTYQCFCVWQELSLHSSGGLNLQPDPNEQKRGAAMTVMRPPQACSPLSGAVTGLFDEFVTPPPFSCSVSSRQSPSLNVSMVGVFP